jgi:hypothetical protein
MASTEWWQRGPVEGIPAVLQPVAHILLQVRESVAELVASLTEEEWNARPAGVASAAFHVRHIAGVIDRLFTYARGSTLSPEQLAAIPLEGQPLRAADIASVMQALSERVDLALAARSGRCGGAPGTRHKGGLPRGYHLPQSIRDRGSRATP